LRGRSGSITAAALIGIGLTIFVTQVTGLSSFSFLLLALGAGFFFAYLNQPSHESNLIVAAGVLGGLGVGSLLSIGDVLPHYLHGALLFGGLALGFGAIYLLGHPRRHHWAMWPAAALGVLAWLNFVTQAPWLKDTFGAVFHLTWPLLIIGAGLWLIERNRRSAESPR
jgi:hypothetical protein